MCEHRMSCYGLLWPVMIWVSGDIRDIRDIEGLEAQNTYIETSLEKNVLLGRPQMQLSIQITS